MSGGQKRRVAIAGVLTMKPEVLILDRPTAGLDPKEEMRSCSRSKNCEQGRTYHPAGIHSMEDVAEYGPHHCERKRQCHV